MSVHWPIIRKSLASPRRVAVIDDRRSWRSIELVVGACHLADLIRRRSSTRTVGVLLPTSGAFPMAALACWMAGRVVVPLNYLLKPEELQYVVDDCETDLVLTAGPLLDFLSEPPRARTMVRLEELSFAGVPEPDWPARAGDDDLATLIYTSGTSGRPKGVMLSHGNLRANIRQAVAMAEFSRVESFFGILPQFHSFGFTVLTLIPLTLGAQVIYRARFSVPQVLSVLRTHRPGVFVAIPSMYNALLHSRKAERDDFSSLRLAISGGEPLPDAVAEGFREKFGVTINEGYGLTETAPVTNICMPGEHTPHSVGPPVPGLEQRIVDIETGAPLGAQQEGEIRFRGPNIMKGYFKLPDETAGAFDEEGLFRTGDIGKTDERGRLFITGRLKEMIIVGGENVFPREIEEVLNAHPSVKASAVVGARDPMRGEVPVAFVELAEGESLDDKALRTWCRQSLAGYKVPRDIRAIDELPRNPTGKIMRRELLPLLDDAQGSNAGAEAGASEQ